MKNFYKSKIRSGAGLISATCLLIASVILVNAWFTTWRIDLTESKLFTLSDGTISIIKELKAPITLDFYLSKTALTEFPQLASYGTRIRDMLEEYESYGGDNLILNIIEPEPFSEEEDQAVASGLQSIAVNATGDRAYFGLVGTNATDDERLIPFFQIAREEEAEYDITKLVYNLSFPERRVVGIMSSLPVLGDDEEKAWTFITLLQEFFDVIDLGAKPEKIDQTIDVLMVIHPKGLSDKEYYAIDQYLLRGGKAMIFIDPLSEQDLAQPPSENTGALPEMSSSFNVILDKWGVEIASDKLATDINAAMRVQAPGRAG